MTKKVVNLIRKSNDLVEARYKLNIWETRIFTKMLTMIKYDDKDFKDYRIYLKDVIDDFDLEKQLSAYDRLKDGAFRLMDKTVRIVRDTDEGIKEFHTKIIAGFENLEEGATYIDVSFHPKMKPYLIQLQKRFTTYDARNILKLPSSYSIRIYELLKQYEGIKERKLDLDDLKELVGAIEEHREGREVYQKDLYPKYGNFKQRVLLKAQRDLANHTDISFTFEPIKRGRKVVAIQFYISKNIPKRERTTPAKRSSPKSRKAQPIESKLYELIEPTISQWPQYPDKELIDSLLAKGKTEDHIRTAVKYTQNRIEAGQDIPNPIGYFVKMVDEASKQGNLFDSVQQKKTQQAERKKADQERKEKAEKRQQEISALYKQNHEKQQQIIEQIMIDYPSAKREIIKELKTKRLSGYDHDKTEEENLSRPLVQAQINAIYRKRFPDELKEVIEEMDRIAKMKETVH